MKDVITSRQAPAPLPCPQPLQAHHAFSRCSRAIEPESGKLLQVLRGVARVREGSAATAPATEGAARETDMEEENGGYADEEEEKRDDGRHDDGLEEEEWDEPRARFGRRLAGGGRGRWGGEVIVTAVDEGRHLGGGRLGVGVWFVNDSIIF